MSDETGGLGGKPNSEITDQVVQKIGQQILGMLAAAGFTTTSAQYRCVTPADLGRLVCAFTRIEDPRVRTECLSLIEAISGSPQR
jgi:hypothetical protein